MTSLRTANRLFAKFFEYFSANYNEPVLSEDDDKK